MKMSFLSRSVVLSISISLMPVLFSPAMAEKTSTKVATISKTAYLAEVRKQINAAGVSSINTSEIISALNRLSMSELVELSEVGKASQLERLIPGVSGAAANAPRDSIQVAKQAGSGTSNNAMAGMLQSQKDMRGGFADSRGQAAAGETCNACKETKTGNGTKDPEKDDIPTATGGKIEHYIDGSKRIVDKNGKATDHFDSEGNFIDLKKIANPDAEQHSGVITAADIKGIAAKRGSNVTPTGEESSHSGSGGIAPTRTSQLGLFTENRTAARISTAQLQEIMRLAAEKLGPKLK